VAAVVLALGLVLPSAPGCGLGPQLPTPAPPSPTAASALARRAVHTATELGNGTALIAGGCDVDGCSAATATAALLTPSGAQPIAPLLAPRDGHTAVLLSDGRVLIAGGYSGENRPPLATAETFEPAQGAWTSVGSMREPRGGHAAARLGDGRVLVAGGWRGPGTPVATSEIFDPRTNRFSAGPALPEAVDGLAATALPDGRVLLTGGHLGDQRAASTAVLVGADGRARTVRVRLRTPRFKHTAVALPSGRVLIIGGTVDDQELLRSTELFDPRTETFTAGPELVDGRYKLNESADVLPDGRVVVAGSGSGVEVVDAERNLSRVVPGLADVSGSFSSVSVVGSQVWVLGGYDRQIRMTSTDRRIPIADL
jgi:hypothetical protein